jgi:hypothetical protein
LLRRIFFLIFFSYGVIAKQKKNLRAEHYYSPFTQYPSPSRSLVRDGQTSPHKPRLVVPHSTCPSLSPSPPAHSFIIGPAVINTHDCLGPMGRRNACRASDAIRSGTRYAKWAGGSRSQTHRRAAMGGFTQDDGYVRGLAPTHDCSSSGSSLHQLVSSRAAALFSPYNLVLDTDTGTGPIPPITVSRVNAYSGGVLARALPQGLRYLST